MTMEKIKALVEALFKNDKARKVVYWVLGVAAVAAVLLNMIVPGSLDWVSAQFDDLMKKATASVAQVVAIVAAIQALLNFTPTPPVEVETEDAVKVEDQEAQAEAIEEVAPVEASTPGDHAADEGVTVVPGLSEDGTATDGPEAYIAVGESTLAV